MEFRDLCVNCFASLGGQAQCSQCHWPAQVEVASPLHLPPRTVLKETYLLGRVLGHGGFGITYAAYEPALGRRLAIKEYLPNGEATRATGERQVHPLSGGAREAFDWGLQKFLEEARVLVRFQDHPGIVKVITFFPENGTAYLVMEHLIGQDFEAKLQAMGGKVGFSSAVLVMMPVVDALREVHKEGILHRDISPDNIILCDNRQIKLIDFGAARYAMSEKSRSLSILIKDGYAPEEQYRLKGKQGPWTDVYAVAATMYRAVTGNLPPTSLDRLHEDELKDPRQAGVELSESAWRVLQRGMALRAAERYASMEEFQADLLATDEARALVSQGMIQAREGGVVRLGPEGKPTQKPPEPEPVVIPTPDPFGQIWRRRKRMVMAGVAALVLALGIYALRKPVGDPPEGQVPAVDVKPAEKAEVVVQPPDSEPEPAPVKPADAEEVREAEVEPVKPQTVTPRPTAVRPVPVPAPEPAPESRQPVEPQPRPPTERQGGFFQAVPPRIRAGEKAQLRWNVPWAERVSLQPGTGEMPSQGSIEVNPTSTTTYELTATGTGRPNDRTEGRTMRTTVQVEATLPSNSGRPATTSYLVRHDHQGVVTGVMGNVFGANRARQIWPHCVGRLSIEAGRLVFRSQQPEHSFSIPLRSIEEVKANRLSLAGKKSFHVNVRGGEKYNFVPEQSVAELVDLIKAAME